MKHIYKKGNKDLVFITLHGTGGDETSLLKVAELIDENANVLSIRGSENENGALRFFKRLAPGVYDVENLNENGEKLLNFIIESSYNYGFKLENCIFLGFSNGSNIAINVLLRKDNVINKAILFAPQYPVDVKENNVDLSDYRLYISMGENDYISPKEDSEYVLNIFKSRNAKIEEFWVNGHEINKETLLQAKKWVEKL